MSTTKEIVSKLYNETLDSGIFVDKDEDTLELIRECEKNHKLVEHDSGLWAFAKTRKNDNDYIRMVFAIKEGGRKVNNIEKITKLIRNIESVIVYIDECYTNKGSGLVYLDVWKKLKPEGV